MGHLLALGHTAIAYLGATNRPRSNQQRMHGYRDALQTADVAVRDGWIQEAPPDRRSYTASGHESRFLVLSTMRAS